MGYSYHSALVFGWEAEELRNKMTEAESEKRYDYVDKIYEQLYKSDYIFDINEDFLYVGKIISDCDIDDYFVAISLGEFDPEKLTREAYERIEGLKEYWEPTEPPTLIHVCYVR